MRKLRNDGVPINVDARLGLLEAALQEVDGLVALYLYGSYGTADQTPLSDVDLALIFRPGRVPDLAGELELIARVTDTLREDDVSVTVLNRCPLPFQHRVVATGRELFCADPVARADFVETVLKRYGDFALDYEPFLREYDRAMVERYGA